MENQYFFCNRTFSKLVRNLSDQGFELPVIESTVYVISATVAKTDLIHGHLPLSCCQIMKRNLLKNNK